MRIITAVATIAFAAASAHAESHRLDKKWETQAQLKIPESVLFDPERKVLYVSNIDGEPWANDGKGSIGKVGLDGKVIAVDWVSGLNAPKGMALRGSKLYVGDLTHVVVIDIDKGAVVERITVSGAEGLNDVAIDSAETVYVSDTKTKKVERADGSSVETKTETVTPKTDADKRDVRDSDATPVRHDEAVRSDGKADATVKSEEHTTLTGKKEHKTTKKVDNADGSHTETTTTTTEPKH